MSKCITAHGKIENGKLRLTHEADFLAELSGLSGDVLVTVEKATRTNLQNAFYFACCTRLAQELGTYKEKIHEANKKYFNRESFVFTNKRTGEIVEETIQGSTARLSKDAFAEFLERCNAGWGEVGYQFLLDNQEET